MESAASVELERSLRQYERHLIRLFAVVILQPDFRRADSAGTILFILELALIGYNGNRNIDIISGKDGRLHHTYMG